MLLVPCGSQILRAALVPRGSQILRAAPVPCGSQILHGALVLSGNLSRSAFGTFNLTLDFNDTVIITT